MRTQMTISVQVFEDGVLKPKQVFLNDCELEVDGKKIKVSELIKAYMSENKARDKAFKDFVELQDKRYKNVVDWELKTNEVLTKILQKLEEQGEVF